MGRGTVRSTKRTVAVLIALLAFAGGMATAADIYVDISQTGVAPDGAGWATAFPDLTDALNLSQSDAGDMIHIAEGVYAPVALGPTYILTSPERSESFVIKRGVTVMGGYPAGGGARDVSAHVTILSGDINADDSTASSAENSYHVVLSDSYVTLDGLTIQAGNANDIVAPNGRYGAGVYAAGEALTVINCKFKNNNAALDGGAIYSVTGDLQVTASQFASDSVGNNGGDLYVNAGQASVTNSQFNDGYADNSGAAIYAQRGGLTITGSNFTNNYTDGDGGAVYVYDANIRIEATVFSQNESNDEGGAIYQEYDLNPLSMTLIDTEFDSCRSYTYGGAISAYGNTNNPSSLSVSNCVFNMNSLTNDEEGYGGAICLLGVDLSVTDSTFTNNWIYNDSSWDDLEGGVIYIWGAKKLTVTNSLFSGNNAYSDDYDVNGGVIYSYRVQNVTISGCTFIANDLSSDGDNVNGGLVYVRSSSILGTSVTFLNNRLAENIVYAYDDIYGGLLYLRADTVLIDGTNVMNNKLSGDYYGYGMLYIRYANSSVSATVRNSFFSSNSLNTTDEIEGGVLSVYGFSSATIQDTVFEDNSVVEEYYYFYGGIIYISSCDTQVIDNVTLRRNSVSTSYNDDDDMYGGMIYSDYFSSLSITDSLFDSNTFISSNYDYTIYGGIIYADGWSGTPVMRVTNTSFIDNAVNNRDYEVDGGILYIEYVDDFYLTQCTFTGNRINSADYIDGGIIYLYDLESFVVDDGLFSNNVMQSSYRTYAGIVYSYSTTQFNMNDCVFDANRITSHNLYGGYTYNSNDTDVAFVDCKFSNIDASVGSNDIYGGFSYGRNLTSLSFSGCLFSGGTLEGSGSAYGGALYNTNIANLTIQDTEFRDLGETSMYLRGGALYLENNIGPGLITRSDFVNCRADIAGAAYVLNCTSVSFIDDTFDSCTADYRAGAILGSASLLNINSCTMKNNSAANDGGAMMVGNAGASYLTHIYDSTFDGNTSTTDGGAINISGDSLIERNTFIGNSATTSGGALYLNTPGSSGITNVINNMFNQNTAPAGSAIYASNNNVAMIVHNSVSGNIANSGGGALHAASSATPFVGNSIFWGDTGGELVEDTPASLSVSACNVQGGFAGGTDIVDLDPLFYDASTGNLRLTEFSPMIDLGSTNLPISVIDDIDSQSRSGLPDIGAHEFYKYLLSGTVSGDIVAGITVNVSPLNLSTTTDASGHYSFSGVISGPLTIKLVLDDYASDPAEYALTLSGSDVTNLDFVTSTAYDMSGNVTGDAVGMNVELTLSGVADAVVLAATDGSFKFDNFLPGSYTITPSLSGYTFVPASLDITITNAHVSGLAFVSYKNYTISGTLTGSMVSGRTLTLIGNGDVQFKQTDYFGNYAFTVYDGEYTVYPPAPVGGTAFTPDSRTVTVADANVSGVDFASVSVYSIFGSAIDNAVILMTGDLTVAVSTNSAGNFQFSNIPDGNYRITPSRDGYVFTPSYRDIVVSGANLQNVTFVATPNSAAIREVSGQVSGAVSAGVQMTLTGDAVNVVLTDGSGNYTFDSLPDGTYTVTPSMAGYAFVPVSQTVTVSGADQLNVNFTAVSVPPTYTVSGQVSGAVLDGVFVLMTGNSTYATYTDAAGAFNLDYVLDGTYTLKLSSPGYIFSPSTTVITVSGADIGSLSFTSALDIFSISGHVTGAVSAGVTVTLTGSSLSTTVTDAAGMYTFENVYGGIYTVTPSATGCVFDPISQAVKLSITDATGIDFSSTGVSGELYTISGIVRGVDASGIILTLTGPMTGSVVTDSLGKFEFTGVLNGNYKIIPTNNDKLVLPYIVNVTVYGGDVTNILFTISESGVSTVKSSRCSISDTHTRTPLLSLVAALFLLAGMAARRRHARSA